MLLLLAVPNAHVTLRAGVTSVRDAGGGWPVAAVEVLASLRAIARGLNQRLRRAVPMLLGLGLLMWALGDITSILESLDGTAPPVPSLTDVFYIGFFPFTCAGLVLFMRGEVRRLSTPSWLAGAVD